MYRWTFCIFRNILLCVFLSSCGDAHIGAADPALLHVIDAYYAHEQRGDWSAAYELRDPRFRGTIQKDYYVKTSEKHNEGWSLSKFEVLSINEDASVVVARIRFSEKAPRSFFETIKMEYKNGEVVSVEDTTWIKIGGAWFCRDAGLRFRLPLNKKIVHP